MTTAEYLAQFGVTMDQAYDFIVAHRDEPAYLWQVAHDSGITNQMLGDIVGYSAADVRGYFNAHGLDAAQLDPPPPPSTLAKLFSEDMAGIASLIQLDPFTSGSLSVAALRERVIADTNAADYAATFDPSHFAGASDGVFTPEELGISHLGTLPATSETLESLFYGTIVTMLRSIDLVEAAQMLAFMTNHEAALAAGDTAVVGEFFDLLVSSASDPAGFLAAFPTSDVADAAVSAGDELVQLVGAGGSVTNLFDGLVDALTG